MSNRWLWLILILNCIIGLLFSPATAVRKVRIMNATPEQVASVKRELQSLRGVPCMRVNNDRFLSQLLPDTSIESAEWQQNWFGRGVLRIRNRQAVASVSPKDNLFMAADGTLFRRTGITTSVQVTTELAAVKPSYSLIGTWEARAVAKVATLINQKIPALSGVLRQDRAGKLTFVSANLAPVILGTTDNADAKVSQLAKALLQQPKLLEQVREVNLSAPEIPRYIPLANDPNHINK